MAVDLSPPPERLVRWMTSTLGALTERGPIVRMELWTGTEATREKIGAYGTDQSSPEELAQEIYDSARAEAETSAGGQVRFFILAFDKGASPNDYHARHPFIIDAPSRPRPFGETPRHAQGADHSVAAIVKAATDTNRIFAERFESLLLTQERASQVAAQRLEETTEALWKATQTIHSMGSDQTAHRIELERLLRDEGRKDKLFAMAAQYVPLLFANATAGTPAANAIAAKGGDPLRIAMKEFLDGIEPEQLMGILDKLPAHKVRGMLAIAEIVGKEAEAEQEREAKQITEGGAQ